ncbi:MAG: hypothetical protein MZW92_47975, partial [Comamonadaceae bacterium]|nr:hypothetical protein [Comamonadaceae bacterium]
MAWLDWRLMLIVLLLLPATVGDRLGLPAAVGAGGDALARAAQRHQRAGRPRASPAWRCCRPAARPRRFAERFAAHQRGALRGA